MFTGTSCKEKQKINNNRRYYPLGQKAGIAQQLRTDLTDLATKVLSDQSGVTIYTDGGLNACLLKVYGVTSKETQDKLVSAVESEQKLKGWRTIYIEFIKEEVPQIPEGSGYGPGKVEVLAVRSLISTATLSFIDKDGTSITLPQGEREPTYEELSVTPLS